jgi:hypothetical protein
MASTHHSATVYLPWWLRHHGKYTLQCYCVLAMVAAAPWEVHTTVLLCTCQGGCGTMGSTHYSASVYLPWWLRHLVTVSKRRPLTWTSYSFTRLAEVNPNQTGNGFGYLPESMTGCIKYDAILTEFHKNKYATTCQSLFILK